MQQKKEITAIVERVLKTQKFDSGFQKRDLILNLDPDSKWENVIPITFIKDKCDLLNTVSKGDKVTVSYWNQGRSYLRDGEPEENRKYYPELRGDSLDIIQTAKNEAIKIEAETARAEFDENGDDLPF